MPKQCGEKLGNFYRTVIFSTDLRRFNQRMKENNRTVFRSSRKWNTKDLELSCFFSQNCLLKHRRKKTREIVQTDQMIYLTTERKSTSDSNQPRYLDASQVVTVPESLSFLYFPRKFNQKKNEFFKTIKAPGRTDFAPILLTQGSIGSKLYRCQSNRKICTRISAFSVYLRFFFLSEKLQLCRPDFEKTRAIQSQSSEIQRFKVKILWKHLTICHYKWLCKLAEWVWKKTIKEKTPLAIDLFCFP